MDMGSTVTSREQSVSTARTALFTATLGGAVTQCCPFSSRHFTQDN